MIGTKIREKREFRSMSQKELATALGHKSQATVSQWERNLRSPSLRDLKNLAILLRCSTDELLEDIPCVTI